MQREITQEMAKDRLPRREADANKGSFGSVLAASFCDALDRRKNRIIFWICIALIPIAQGIIYYVWDDGFLRQIYPLLVHVPLILLLLRNMSFLFYSNRFSL